MQLIPEVVTVTDARAGLSRILADLEQEGAAAEPVLIGSHRKAQGVLLSIEAYEALRGRTARRARVDSATASVAVEGLRTSPEADRDAEAYVDGELSADEAVARATVFRAR
ncbi:type II toxin-antitoxin system Phd/YefM family antitoxin [Streptomyces sp. 21So2-11]|uniref:antitoxin VbhA family protein n=1 Tax=Streptomyces sp. 21So2-11 TaxID=3144408 RepID=UPI00321BEFBF